MPILFFNCDTLLPDHLGCYGYQRDTSPNLDEVASKGIRFTNYHASDAPCLPSRCALVHSRFGIHTGVVGHGGTAADIRPEGEERVFSASHFYATLPQKLCNAGFHTVSISPFADRHAAWWFYNGFREMVNTGRRGQERAEEVTTRTLRWLDNHAEEDNWFLHGNFWDPHTSYRTPEDYGNPFEHDPHPSRHADEILQQNRERYGDHSALEPMGFPRDSAALKGHCPKGPREITSLGDYKEWVDGYDTAIYYMDYHIGQILETLKGVGGLDELIIVVTSDQSENKGELNVYGDHQTADHITSGISLIIRAPGITASNRIIDSL